MKYLYPLLNLTSLVYLGLVLIIPNIFIDWGWSWTLIYLLPLIMPALVLLNALLIFVFQGRWKEKWHIALLLNLALLGFYLAEHPVYEGDLSNGGVMMDFSEKNQEIKSWDSLNIEAPSLMVYVDYNCPHCKEAVQKLGVLKERSPEANIWVSLVQEDTSYLKRYEAKTGVKNLNYKLNAHADAAVLYQHRFPSFILNNDGVLKYWSNNEMGSRAWDEIENVLTE